MLSLKSARLIWPYDELPKEHKWNTVNLQVNLAINHLIPAEVKEIFKRLWNGDAGRPQAQLLTFCCQQLN